MGRKVSGESVLPTHHREVSLPLERLRRHVLVLGASGSGKTETLLRLPWATARVSDWAVFFLDAKGDADYAPLPRADGRHGPRGPASSRVSLAGRPGEAVGGIVLGARPCGSSSRTNPQPRFDRTRKAGVMGSNPIVGLQSSHVRSRRSTLSALPEVSPTGEHVARTAITDAPREPQR